MHQSFATTSPSGLGNSGDIDFSLSKARVYAQHCRDTLMVKALRKSPLKAQQVNVNFHGHFGTGIKTPAIPRHCGDNAEVKTLQLSLAMPPLFPAPRGAVVANDWCIRGSDPMGKLTEALILIAVLNYLIISPLCLVWV